MNDWRIYGKVISIVTDNAQNMVSACSLMRITQIRCIAYSLNLTVQHALKKVEDLI
jgi:hypothetical protein